jgi:SagB-type dehydrogenase family enzyme
MSRGSIPSAPVRTAWVELAGPALDGRHTVERALHDRRSAREYHGRALAPHHLSQLLWAAQGVTGTGGGRTAPSAGGLYPLEIHVAVGNVVAVPAGLYRYAPARHALELRGPGDCRRTIAAAALDQAWIENAAAVLVVAAVYRRTTATYGERGRRYVHMEAGHVAQNVYLQATALGLGTVVVGAFDDVAVKQAAELSGAEEPICLMPLGVPAWSTDDDP